MTLSPVIIFKFTTIRWTALASTVLTIDADEDTIRALLKKAQAIVGNVFVNPTY